MRKSISLKEIAQIAGVSHSTVSRALNNSLLISREMAEQIHKIAAERGYRPNRNARSLVTQRSMAVGCVVTNIADPFIGEVMRGVEEIASQEDYSIILTHSGGNPDREMKAVRSLCERTVDGVIVVASRVGGAYVPYLLERQVPIVLVNNQHPSDFVHSVTIANYEAARAVILHLGELGHKHIAYIGDQFGGQSNAERHAGYRAALKEMGIRYAPKLVVSGESTPASGEHAMSKLLTLPTPPTAIFCYDDITALGAYRTLQRFGLRIPHDISIAGFDGLFFAEFLQPSLTTVEQPMHEMGELAMKLLLELLSTSRKDASPIKTQIIVHGKLVVRDSTASPRPKSLKAEHPSS
jgi:DNA-binding LacI/PurR family transcriptional regulator